MHNQRSSVKHIFATEQSGVSFCAQYKEAEMIRFHLKKLMADYEHRHGQRLTMGELSAKTGIYRTTLSRIAGPKPFNTTTENLDALCRFFGCQIGDLVEYVDSPEAGK
jgi:putative transcriptional regulator